MDVILTVLTPLVVGILALAVFTLMRREGTRKNEKLNREDFVIRSSYVWGVIMLIVIAFLLFIVIAGNITEPMGYINILFAVLILVLLYGSLTVFRDKVRIKGEEIIHTPAIGKKRVYSFSQIEKIEQKRAGYYIKSNGKTAFVLEINSIGAKLFIELASERDIEIE